MASSVRSRPTYYDMLGLSPAASEEDIKRAFARSMGMFGAHSAAAAAQVSAAFGILRDAGKRRTYDRSIGVLSDPPPRQWGFSATAAPPPTAPGLLGSAWRGLAEQVAGEPPQPAPPAPEEPRLASFIASSVRDPAAPLAQQPAPEAEAERQPIGEAHEECVAQVQRELEHILRPRTRELPISAEIEDRPFDWRRPALVAGGLLLSAGVIGAFAGMSVRDNEQPTAVQSVGRPAGKAASAAVSPVAPSQAPPSLAAPVAHEIAALPRRHKIAPQQVQPQPAFVEEAVDQSQAAQTTLDGSGAAIATSDSGTPAVAAPQPTPADLPLPKSVVARTIERIGYSCGSVVSTSGGETPGVFTITCSSGQTYRASPVHGRYRFSRAGGR
jgi:hypothetical protein